jgi:hypothetical protein
LENDEIFLKEDFDKLLKEKITKEFLYNIKTELSFEEIWKRINEICSEIGQFTKFEFQGMENKNEKRR